VNTRYTYSVHVSCSGDCESIFRSLAGSGPSSSPVSPLTAFWRTSIHLKQTSKSQWQSTMQHTWAFACVLHRVLCVIPWRCTWSDFWCWQVDGRLSVLMQNALQTYGWWTSPQRYVWYLNPVTWQVCWLHTTMVVIHENVTEVREVGKGYGTEHLHLCHPYFSHAITMATKSWSNKKL